VPLRRWSCVSPCSTGSSDPPALAIGPRLNRRVGRSRGRGRRRDGGRSAPRARRTLNKLLALTSAAFSDETSSCRPRGGRLVPMPTKHFSGGSGGSLYQAKITERRARGPPNFVALPRNLFRISGRPDPASKFPSGSAVRIYVCIPWSLCDLALILARREPPRGTRRSTPSKWPNSGSTTEGSQS
jgi:hypothetical protein